MSKKLLVITAGTVAASVGQALMRQTKTHPGSELKVMVRYIDTAYLPQRYSTLRPGEWFQLSINPRYMQAIYDKQDEYPTLRDMLYEGLLPGTDVSGGGSIRYNGAGAVEVKHEDLRKWLSASMTELARAGDGDTNISVALIISAVGATGSGSLEHLVNVIIDAAHFANIRSTSQSTIRCDVYILQPSQDITDLGLANTLALYTELAASQLSNGKTRAYQGRKIMIGWGSNKALSSIDQLREVAANIIRLSSDPSSAFAAEFQEREVDNHVLRELDPVTRLPMHLSLVTVVTISLGRLEEQVIARDVERLVDSLVFHTSDGGNTSNALLGRFSDALAGESPDDRYRKLLDYLSEAVHLDDAKRRLETTLHSKNVARGDKADRLDAIWQEARHEIVDGRHRIQDFTRTFLRDAVKELQNAKGERICKGGLSLTELREEYRVFENVLHRTLEVAREQTQITVNDSAVRRQRQALDGVWPFRLLNRKTKLRRLAGTMKTNLDEHLQASCRSSAIMALEQLEQLCAEVGRNLDIVLHKLRRQRDEQLSTATPTTAFSVETGNPLNISALSTEEEMKTYASHVSVFTSDAHGPEQLAEFRQWLQGRPALESLFKGNLYLFFLFITTYTTEKVHEAMEKRSVLEVLRRAGEDTLRLRLSEGAAKATALVNYSEDFAPERREAWHVSAFFKNEEQREELNKIIVETFAQGQCKLLKSSDPAEIAIFYYVDGIPMSAVEDLKGRCLNAFLKRRQQWHQQKKSLNGSSPVGSIDSLNQRVGVPIFSGKDAEQRVKETNVVKKLYSVRGQEVSAYKVEEIPELQENGKDAIIP